MRIIIYFAALGINYARQGVARQSSRYVTAQRGIDGKIGGTSNNANCILTDRSNDPWWKVYFNTFISVHEVIIHNRYDWRGK